MKGLVAAFVVLVGTFQVAYANGGHVHTGEAAIARHQFMEFFGSQMRILGQMSQGRIAFDANYVKSVGEAISAMSLALPLLFDEEVDTAEGSKVSPQVFHEWNYFLEMNASLGLGAKKLADSEGIEDVQASFQQLGAACQSCHSQYRLR